jgi:DNA polymerase III sliding clamp (beta) subunit (PCNA family)
LLFASDEETRYYLKGVHLLRRGDHLRITATDGHRLFCAMQTLTMAGDDFDVILPRDGLKKALTGVHRNCEVLALDLEWDGDRVKRAVLNDLAMAPG